MSVTRSILKPLIGKRVEVTRIGGARYMGYLTKVGTESLVLSQVSIFNKYLGASTDEPIDSRAVTYVSIHDIREL